MCGIEHTRVEGDIAGRPVIDTAVFQSGAHAWSPLSEAPGRPQLRGVLREGSSVRLQALAVQLRVELRQVDRQQLTAEIVGILREPLAAAWVGTRFFVGQAVEFERENIVNVA